MESDDAPLALLEQRNSHFDRCRAVLHTGLDGVVWKAMRSTRATTVEALRSIVLRLVQDGFEAETNANGVEGRKQRQSRSKASPHKAQSQRQSSRHESNLEEHVELKRYS